MTVLILSIALLVVYVLGGFFATIVIGWEPSLVKDIFKIIFWPIALIICSK